MHADYIETPQGIVPRLSDGQIADLTASVALYPDPLLSEMLPAATYVQELTYVDKWLTQHPGASEASIAALPVDDSVKCMVHYPTVLAMMTNHLDWTQSLGAAFIYQQQDVMDSIQRWRMTAVTYGTLSSTPQLDVLQQGQTILIVPPPHVNVLYVPTYDPAVVYVRPVRPLWGARNETFISFAAGGFSLTFIDNDVDWHHHEVHVPVHHDADWDRDHVRDHYDSHPAGSPPAGRGTVVEKTVVEKTVFTHEPVKSAIVYPEKVVTPQPDKKEVVIKAAKPGSAPAVMRAGETNPPLNGRGPVNSNGRGAENGRGPADRGPNTPF